MKEMAPQLSSSHYMAPYPSHNARLTIHDRRQSMIAGRGKTQTSTPPTSDRSRPTYSSQAPEDASTAAVGSWETAQPSSHDNTARNVESYSSVQTNLPPLSEALHGIKSESSPSMAISPPSQPSQATFSAVGNVVASPPNFYAPTPYLDVQAPLHVYPTQEQFEGDPSRMPPQDRQPPVSAHPMVSQDNNPSADPAYARRVTYPFVPALESATGLVMSSVMTETAGASPLSNSGPFAHSGLVAPGSVSVQGMTRTSPGLGYVDSLSLQPHHSGAYHSHPAGSAHHHHQQQRAMNPAGWSQDGADMSSLDGCINGSKVYSFVPLSGVNSKKRPRRRFDEIERLYVCNWGECEKAYGTLNHLNAHVHMQKHGPKRLPAEFKELRKAWRKHKRAEEEASKQAAAFQQQQSQNQHAQMQPLCDPLMTHMHAAAAAGHHPLAMHSMAHHQQPQPHQLPLPHAHPNQHPHNPHHSQSAASQHHHHQMGF
ncbi:hypothetical protein BGZ96_001242 [Linnemannia gamsii]|uniref:C2H2-type domain-containing protein n=1 Tax=Linnemannia gamsii TaxID=64522 RepID=A0ABQ7KGA9_9FUNG|nr:hypothetical protein BGZ96_001242 [Linnemannia gamsii]